jgi:hypothetical protein
MAKQVIPRSKTLREKRAQVRFSGPLLRVFEAAAAERGSPLSTLIRDAMVEYAKQLPAELIERAAFQEKHQ